MAAPGSKAMAQGNHEDDHDRAMLRGHMEAIGLPVLMPNPDDLAGLTLQDTPAATDQTAG